ncbi:MAG TPA: class E sortase, partial [Streptomyces sp.]
MTGLGPEPDAGQNGPYARGAYEADGAFEAAVGQLADPLNDPLPGRHASPWSGEGQGDQQAGQGQRDPLTGGRGAPGRPQAPQQPQREWYDPEGYERDWYGQQEARTPSHRAPAAR